MKDWQHTTQQSQSCFFCDCDEDESLVGAYLSGAPNLASNEVFADGLEELFSVDSFDCSDPGPLGKVVFRANGFIRTLLSRN